MNNCNRKRIKVREVVSGFITVGAIIALYCLVGCPIRFFTGICCPGCGMTRAAMALLHLDFAGAFYFHPMIYSVPAVVAVVLFRKKIPGKVLAALAIAWSVMMLAVYIYRLLSGSSVVYVDIKSSCVYRLILLIMQRAG